MKQHSKRMVSWCPQRHGTKQLLLLCHKTLLATFVAHASNHKSEFHEHNPVVPWPRFEHRLPHVPYASPPSFVIIHRKVNHPTVALIGCPSSTSPSTSPTTPTPSALPAPACSIRLLHSALRPAALRPTSTTATSRVTLPRFPFPRGWRSAAYNVPAATSLPA